MNCIPYSGLVAKYQSERWQYCPLSNYIKSRIKRQTEEVNRAGEDHVVARSETI